MSGGSYNYLYRREADELLDRIEDLTAMRDRLSELGAADVVAEVDEILTAITTYREEVDLRMERVSGVFQAVEWEDSNDGYPGQVEDALTKYRSGIE